MLRTERHAAVTRLVIDNPTQKNALTPQIIDALPDALAAADADPECRCIVITGSGSDFCTGRNLADASPDWPLDRTLAYDNAWRNTIEALWRLGKPSVAVVRGYAVAGGFTLAMACDFALAASDARFGALEMRRGFPAAVNTAVLAHKAAPRHALELLLSADTFSAARLEAMGLLNRVTDSAELDAVADAFITGLAALDATAVRLTKETYRAAVAMPYAESLTLGAQLNSLLMASGRISEAAAGFAKGKPGSASR